MFVKTNRVYAYLTALSGAACAYCVTIGSPTGAAFTAFGTIVGFFATISYEANAVSK